MEKNFLDLFSKAKFEEELAAEISKDFKRNLTNSPPNNAPNNNRHD